MELGAQVGEYGARPGALHALVVVSAVVVAPVRRPMPCHDLLHVHKGGLRGIAEAGAGAGAGAARVNRKLTLDAILST